MSSWKAFAGRVTLIANVPSAPMTTASKLFEQALGVAAQNYQAATNPLMPSNAQGVVGGLLVRCTTFPNRIDFHLSADANAKPGVPPSALTLQLIEDGKLLTDRLSGIIEALGKGGIDVGGVVNRVALFLQVTSLQPDWMTANKALSQVMPEPYRVRLSDEERFSLQVARPSNVAGTNKATLVVSTKWSVEQFQVLTFGFTLGGVLGAAAGASPQAGLMQPQVGQFLGSTIALDCQSSMTAIALTPDEQAAFLREGLLKAVNALGQYGVTVQGLNDGRTTH